MDKRNKNQELIKQCTDFFNREQQYWQRLLHKRTSVTEEEILAKKDIIEVVYRVGAAAAIEEQKGAIDTLLWDYREMKAVIADYEGYLKESIS